MIDTGGKAYVSGSRNDGIIDYKKIYEEGSNVGVVGIDNARSHVGP